MADLNELSQFEKDLKNLIESREIFQPTYAPSSSYKSSTDATYMVASEHGQPYRNHITDMTFMVATEHGQPYRTPRVPSHVPGMYMGSYEHGQQYKTPSMVTRMAVVEHGRPFIALTNMAVREHGQPYMSTNMAVREHGQPYRPTRIVTKMAIGEHGKPFKWSDFFG